MEHNQNDSDPNNAYNKVENELLLASQSLYTPDKGQRETAFPSNLF